MRLPDDDFSRNREAASGEHEETIMNRLFSIPIVSLGLLGCNQSAPPAAVMPEGVVVAAPEAAPQPAVQAPKKEEPPPPVFPFPNDAAGKGEAHVPSQYRRRVGAYFQRIADESGQ